MFDRRAAILGAGATAFLASAGLAVAPRSHVVEMLTQDPETGRRMVFTPRILRVASGDTVTFRPSQPMHNSMSTPGMVPEGASGWRGSIGKSVSVTFTKPGYYGYHCLPHKSMGMVGLVIVEGEGLDANLEAAQSVRQTGKAKEAWDEIWAEVASM